MTCNRNNWSTKSLKSSTSLAKSHLSMNTLDTKHNCLGLQLKETRKLLQTVKNNMKMSKNEQEVVDDNNNVYNNFDNDVNNNILMMTRVKGQPLTKYKRDCSKHKIDTTRILNKSFLKSPPEPSVVPRGSNVMRIRNDETLRNIGRLPIHVMMTHSPTVMADRLRADKVYEQQAGKKSDRMVFVSGSGYVYKSLPPKGE